MRERRDGPPYAARLRLNQCPGCGGEQWQLSVRPERLQYANGGSPASGCWCPVHALCVPCDIMIGGKETEARRYKLAWLLFVGYPNVPPCGNLLRIRENPT
jgi:hypothetical protein